MAEVRACRCERVQVLCGCGWGSLGMPACAVPELCPVCGFDLWSLGGVPEPCAKIAAAESGAR